MSSEPTTKKFQKGERQVPAASEKAQKYYGAEEDNQNKKVRSRRFAAFWTGLGCQIVNLAWSGLAWYSLRSGMVWTGGVWKCDRHTMANRKGHDPEQEGTTRSTRTPPARNLDRYPTRTAQRADDGVIPPPPPSPLFAIQQGNGPPEKTPSLCSPPPIFCHHHHDHQARSSMLQA